jgi:preprotein translocase subunit SecD
MRFAHPFALAVIAVGSAGCTSGTPTSAAPQDRVLRSDRTTDTVQTALFEVRLAETKPARDLVEARVQNSNRRVFLHDALVITNNDVDEAHVVEAGVRFNVGITLTSEGAEKLEFAMWAHTGRPLAIIIDGAVVAAPTVVRGASAVRIVIPRDFTIDQAGQIVGGLQGWLRKNRPTG